MQVQTEEWQHGDWHYTWQANGMLKSVKKPDGSIVEFEYDALGRRTAKIVQSLRDTKQSQIHRFVWDGNVLLHEWNYEQKKRTRFALDGKGEFVVGEETVENLITWVYEDGSFVPSAKIVANETFSIISDYIGRPVQAYSSDGNKVWETDYDIYGRLRNLQGEKMFIPFRQLGQYEDEEVEGLYYNRFRYYDCNIGGYISQDPIGLEGNNPNFYAYTHDSNSLVDVIGLNECPIEQALRDLERKYGSSNSHSVDRHGAGTTMLEQQRRAMQGKKPDLPYNPRRDNPVNSTRFLSNSDHLEAYNKIIDNFILDQGVTAISRGFTVTVDMGRDVAEGFYRGGLTQGTTSQVIGYLDSQGNIITVFGNL